MTQQAYLRRIRAEYDAAMHQRNVEAQAYWRCAPGAARRLCCATGRLNAARNRMNRMTRCTGRMRGESWLSHGPIRRLPA